MDDKEYRMNVQKAVPKTQKTREQELTEAVERVYRKYGSDLPAFIRDVQRDMVKLVSAGCQNPQQE